MTSPQAENGARLTRNVPWPLLPNSLRQTSISAFCSKATELKKRIWFTLGALIVYRIGTYIPVPGVDASVMTEMLQQHGGGILGMFDMFTGGALRRMTVFALNIMPYISASIIIQLMTAAVPSLEALKKEGEAGRKKLNQYTRYLTVFIADVPVLWHRRRAGEHARQRSVRR